MIAEWLIDRDHYYGTINCDGVNAKGEVCGVTTTSGLAWKIPGRAGDSPILDAAYDSTYAVCTENGAQTPKTDSLFGQLSPDGRR